MKIVFHLGLHKTATSWFQTVYYKKHPQINILNSLINIPWDDELISYLVHNNSYSFSKEKYQKLVKNRIAEIKSDPNNINLISAERLAGHPFSGGVDRETIARNIHSAFPDANILLFVRSQADIIDSMYKQVVQEGFIGSIDDFLNYKGWRIPSFDLKYYNYDLLAKTYFDIFNSENIKIVLYEEFNDNPNLVFEDMNDFFGVENYSIPISDFVNKSQSIKILLIKRLINRFRRTEYNRHSRINIKYNLFVRIMIRGLSLLMISRKSFLSDKDRQFIKDYYRESNEKFFSKNDYNSEYQHYYF